MRGVVALALAGGIAAFQSPARAFEPEEPAPPEPAPFQEPPPPPPAAFRDTRLAVTYGAGVFSTSTHGSGVEKNAWSIHLDHSWSSGLPGFFWSVGLEGSLATTSLARPGSTLYLLDANLGYGYGIPITYNLQAELLPYVELVSAAIDHPFSTTVADGYGFGGGGKLTLAYTFDSGLQLSAVGGYSARWIVLAGDCATCAVSGYSDHAVAQVGRGGLAIGKRF